MGSLTKALGAADLGTTLSKIDLNMAQADQASRMADMDAEKVRALRLQNDVSAQQDERLNKPVAVSNLRELMNAQMPWATDTLEKYARVNNMIESPDGTPESEYLTVRNMDSILRDMQSKDSPLVPMIKKAEIEHLDKTAMTIQQQLASDPKMKPEDRAALQQKLSQVKQQRVQAAIDKSHLDKIIANATPDSAAAYLGSGNPADLEGKNEMSSYYKAEAARTAEERKGLDSQVRSKRDRLTAITAEEGQLTQAENTINRVLGGLDKASGMDMMAVAAALAGANKGAGTNIPMPQNDSPAEKERLRSRLSSELEDLKSRRGETQKQKQAIMDELKSLESSYAGSANRSSSLAKRPEVFTIGGKTYTYGVRPKLGGE